jgi:hypothetical protein
MALQKPTYCGTDNIMAAYDSINGDCQYYYSVWHSQKDIAFQYVGDDATKAREYLKSNLMAMEQAGNDNLLYLKFHPSDKKSKYIENKTTVLANTPICAVELEEGAIAGDRDNTAPRDRTGDAGYQMYKTRMMLEDLPSILDQKINVILDERLNAAHLVDEDEEPEIEPVDKIVGIINGIAANPQIMGLIGQVLNFLKPQLQPVRINGMNQQEATPPAEQNTQPAPAPEPQVVSEEILNEALNRLSQHCRVDTDLLLLADMADNDPAQFQFLLNMLRKR